jgi:hypothetical protein
MKSHGLGDPLADAIVAEKVEIVGNKERNAVPVKERHYSHYIDNGGPFKKDTADDACWPRVDSTDDKFQGWY